MEQKAEKYFFMILDGKQSGPMGETELRDLFKKGVFSPDIKVWTDDMEDWTPACELKEFKDIALNPPPLLFDNSESDKPESADNSPSSDITDSDKKSDTLNEAAETTEYPLEFKGNWQEYFKIWIVNLGLKIITLGIYSPWAKIRKKQYFYGSTNLDGSSFTYSADPVKILIGRIIVILLGAAYLSSRFFTENPFLTLGIMGIFALMMPMMMMKSIAFTANASGFRNIKFAFDGKAGQAYVVYFLLNILIIPTLGIIYSYIKRRQYEYVGNNLRFGKTKFDIKVDTSDVFYIYLKAAGIAFLSGILFMVVSFFVSIFAGVLFGENTQIMTIIISLISILTYLGTYYLINAYTKAQFMNLFLNSSNAGEVSFKSTLSGSTLFGIQFTNFLAIIFSLGFLIPWARIRVLKYKLECVSLKTCSGFGNFIAAEQTEKVSAVGEEAGEFFDFDFGF